MMENASIVATEFFNQHRLFFDTMVWLVICVTLAQNLIYLLQLPAAWWALRRYSSVNDMESAWQTLLSETTIPVTVIVPAHNEEAVIVESVRCLLALQYPEIEIIVVNDGSSDATLAALCAAYDLAVISRAYDEALQHEPIN
ncbi:glycosyltransferase, partial [Propionivibrio sp.]|uniref:glycosyltransferase n=1 Tax=Propionivibrio sp. TaxID=2212460 RepID=UPI00262745BB